MNDSLHQAQIQEDPEAVRKCGSRAMPVKGGRTDMPPTTKLINEHRVRVKRARGEL